MFHTKVSCDSKWPAPAAVVCSCCPVQCAAKVARHLCRLARVVLLHCTAASTARASPTCKPLSAQRSDCTKRQVAFSRHGHPGYGALLQVHLKLDSKHEAASAYVEAGKAYGKVDKGQAMRALHKASTMPLPAAWTICSSARCIWPQLRCHLCLPGAASAAVWASGSPVRQLQALSS